MSQQNDQRQSAWNLTFVGMIFGQVGLLTIVLIVLALVGGLWLDNTFETKPLFTLIFMLASVPLDVYLMYKVVSSATERLKTEKKTPEEERNRGA
jgi:F0F1-type ATP synthase assembly protein I